jgi:hypothetical protein
MVHASDELGPATEPKPRYAPGVLIVKFKEPVADQLKAALVRGEPLHEVSTTPCLDALNSKYGLKEMRMLFESFQVKDSDGRITRIETMEDHVGRVRERFPVRATRGAARAAEPDLTRVFVLQLSDTAPVLFALAEYAADPAVNYAQPDYVVELDWVPNDPYYGSSNSWGQGYEDLWGIKRVRCAEAWDISRGEGVLIAVIDTGIWYRQAAYPPWCCPPTAHPDIVSNLWHNYAECTGLLLNDDDNNGYMDDAWGRNFVRPGEGPYVGPEDCVADDPLDFCGHGTHVAGTAAAVGEQFHRSHWRRA